MPGTPSLESSVPVSHSVFFPQRIPMSVQAGYSSVLGGLGLENWWFLISFVNSLFFLFNKSLVGFPHPFFFHIVYFSWTMSFPSTTFTITEVLMTSRSLETPDLFARWRDSSIWRSQRNLKLRRCKTIIFTPFVLLFFPFSFC